MAKPIRKPVPKRSKIGYCKPPVHTQFKPGRSGNPRGRPKNVQDAGTLLFKAVNKRTVVNIHGKQHKVSKLELACMQLANKAASGDTRSILSLFKSLGNVPPKLEIHDDIKEQRRIEAQNLARLSTEELDTLLAIMEKLGLWSDAPSESTESG
jgi:hypothetical protein